VTAAVTHADMPAPGSTFEFGRMPLRTKNTRKNSEKSKWALPLKARDAEKEPKFGLNYLKKV
jgi:hypothetical protein